MKSYKVDHGGVELVVQLLDETAKRLGLTPVEEPESEPVEEPELEPEPVEELEGKQVTPANKSRKPANK